MIYLDAATTVPTSEGVRERMDQVLSKVWGNPSGSHAVSRSAKNLLEQAREQCADICGVKPDQIVFSSGATEALNLVIQGYFRSNPDSRFFHSAIEHPAVAKTAEWIKKSGIETIEIPVNSNGIVDLGFLEQLHSNDLVSILPVNNEIGVCNDVEAISEIVKNKEAKLLLDCVQSFYSFDVRKLCSLSDFAVFSAHKLGGPQGVGMLFLRDRSSITPLSFGGSQEWELRPGTTPVYLCDAFSYVFSSAYSKKQETIAHLNTCKELCEKLILEKIPNAAIHASGAQRSPHIVSIDIPSIEAQMLVAMLDKKEVCVSRGSACASGAQTPSKVLLALGISEADAMSTIRMSFYHGTQFSEIEQAVEIIADCVAQINSALERSS